MRKRLLAGALVATCVLGAGIGLTAGVSDRGDDGPADGVAVRQGAFSDQGPPGDVERVRADIPRLITGDVAAGRLSEDDLENPAEVMGPEQSEAREDLTAQVWAPSEVADQSAALEEGIQLVLDDPAYVPYVDNRFVVTEWQGSRITDQNAYGQVIGHTEFKSEDGTWSADEDEQHQVHLVRAERAATFHWLLTARFAVSLRGG